MFRGATNRRNRLVCSRPRSWYRLSVQIEAINDSPEHRGRQSTVQTVDPRFVPPRFVPGLTLFTPFPTYFVMQHPKPERRTHDPALLTKKIHSLI